MLRIDITAMEPGIHRVQLEPDAAALDLEPEKFSDIRVDAVLDVHERRVLVGLTVRAVAALVCDRTLRPFDQEIEGAWHVLFSADALEEDHESVDEVAPLEAGQNRLDVTASVRDTLILAVPQRCVAPGAEDLDIQTVFGRNDADVDPRWEKLKRLRS